MRSEGSWCMKNEFIRQLVALHSDSLKKVVRKWEAACVDLGEFNPWCVASLALLRVCWWENENVSIRRKFNPRWTSPALLAKNRGKNPSALWIRDIHIEAWEKIVFSLAPPPALVAQHFVLWIIVRCGKNCRCASKNWFSLGKNWDAFDWLRGNFKWGKFRFVKKKWKGKKNIFYHKDGI